MGTTQLLILAGLALAAWYLWPLATTGSTAEADGSSEPKDDRPPPPEQIFVVPPAPDPILRDKNPSACEAVKALVVMRDRLEAIEAPRDDINRLLEFAPQLLSKDGLRGNQPIAAPMAPRSIRTTGSSDPADEPHLTAGAQSEPAAQARRPGSGHGVRAKQRS